MNPTAGYFIYIAARRALLDDLSAYQDENNAGFYDKLDGYIVEFSGFETAVDIRPCQERTKTVGRRK
jgi:hypothetical protein